MYIMMTGKGSKGGYGSSSFRSLKNDVHVEKEKQSKLDEKYPAICMGITCTCISVSILITIL